MNEQLVKDSGGYMYIDISGSICSVAECFKAKSRVLHVALNLFKAGEICQIYTGRHMANVLEYM